MESDLIKFVMSKSWINWIFYWMWRVGLYDVELNSFHYILLLTVCIIHIGKKVTKPRIFNDVDFNPIPYNQSKIFDFCFKINSKEKH
jgi:hypothetical protein